MAAMMTTLKTWTDQELGLDWCSVTLGTVKELVDATHGSVCHRAGLLVS